MSASSCNIPQEVLGTSGEWGGWTESCEVKRKRFRRAPQVSKLCTKRLPGLRMRLLSLTFKRYQLSHAIRKASWEAGAAAYLASDSSDVLALRSTSRCGRRMT